MEENNNQELIQTIQELNQNLCLANNRMINSIARTDDSDMHERRYKIANVLVETDVQRRKLIINSIGTAAATACFMACSMIAANDLGINFTMEELQAMSNYFDSNYNSMLGDMVESTMNNFALIENATKLIFTPENIKNLLSNLGSVGYVSGVLSLIGLKNIGSNTKKLSALNKEYRAMSAVYNEDCSEIRRNLQQQSCDTLNSLRNSQRIIRQNLSNMIRNVRSLINVRNNDLNLQSGLNVENEGRRR